MTYCEGQNCDKKETCERYLKTNHLSSIDQITDFSTSGSGQCNRDGVLISPYCGLNSKYDYYIPNENCKIIEQPIEDKFVISIPKNFINKVPDFLHGLNSDNIGEFSDGYHTFNELYHHRAILFAVICNQFKKLAWKSTLHSDDTMYDDMFIVGINTPQGPATYHYNIEPYWDLFDCKELPKAPEWDGHTPDDAIKRIYSLVEDNKPLTTLEMINAANKNGFTYECVNMRYSSKKGFHDKDGFIINGEQFNTLNEVMNIKTWKILCKES